MADKKLTGNRREWLNWSKREPAEAAAKVWEMVRKHESTLGWRHQMAYRGALAYSGAGLGDLFEGLPFDQPFAGNGRRRRKRGGWFVSRDDEQHARAICETAVEKLFGMDEPKTQMVATDAPWEVRRQGVWADRFVEGTYHLEQGGDYATFWELARQGALLSFCSTGTVAIRTEPDFVAKRVRSRLRSTLNTFIDPADRGAERPLTYVDVTWESPEYLCEDERFKGKEDMIWAAACVPKHLQSGAYDGATFNTPMVRVATAWRMPFGAFKGRHAVFVGGDMTAGDGVLHWEDWEQDTPPLAFFRCNRAIGDDFWGENMIEVALRPLADAQEIDEKAKLTMERTSQTYMNLDGNSTAPAAMLNAKDVVAFRYTSNKGEKPVDILKPGILNGDYFDWQQRKINLAHELTGVSLMHQAGEVQGAAGHRSGRSIRLEASMLPERFARKLRNWRNWVAVDCAKIAIRAAQEIGKVDPNWQVTWPGVDYDAKVKVDVLDIDMTAYTIRPYAVSEQKGTPAERADAAQELYDRGEINDSQLSAIIEGLYDTKYETKAATAERAYVAKTIDEMLYGDEEIIADEATYMRDRYNPPLPWMDPQLMLAAAAPKFTQAMIDGVPQNRRALVRRFMEDIWALRQQQIREEKLQEASLNIAAKTSDPFAAAAGAGPAAPALGMPAAAGAPQLPGSLGAPGAPLGAPPGGPPLNAPGAPGLI